jgi:gluconolactonase
MANGLIAGSLGERLLEGIYMKKILICALQVIALGVTFVKAQTPQGDVVKLDPALDAVVSPSAKVEIIKGDQVQEPSKFYYFGSLEGPVWVQDGPNEYLLFCDIPANTIYKWTPDGTVSVFLEKSGFTGADASNAGMQVTLGRLTVIFLGASGLALDPQGRVVIAALAGRNVTRIEKDGTRTVLADRYDGKRLSGPNDLVVKSDGAVFFTDFTAGLRGRDNDPLRELPFNGVYVVKDGQVRLLAKDPEGIVPNGIALSPDEKYLYVGGGKKVVRFDLLPDNTVANGHTFVDMTTETAPGAVDGMRVDQKGNIYFTGPGGIWIVSSAGKHLGTIHTPGPVANLAFGDADGRTIYFAGRRNLLRMRVNIPGVQSGTRH